MFDYFFHAHNIPLSNIFCDFPFFTGIFFPVKIKLFKLLYQNLYTTIQLIGLNHINIFPYLRPLMKLHYLSLLCFCIFKLNLWLSKYRFPFLIHREDHFISYRSQVIKQRLIVKSFGIYHLYTMFKLAYCCLFNFFIIRFNDLFIYCNITTVQLFIFIVLVLFFRIKRFQFLLEQYLSFPFFQNSFL